MNESWVLARASIIKAAERNKLAYDSKYKKEHDSFKVGDSVRIKQPLTPVGLKKKLRNNHWSDAVQVTKVISEQNVEVRLPNGKLKVLNVNNVKRSNEEAKFFEEKKTQKENSNNSSNNAHLNENLDLRNSDANKKKHKNKEIVRDTPVETRSGRISKPIIKK